MPRSKKRAFVRGLWGIYSQENFIIERRYKMDYDIRLTIANKFSPPSVTYVFGLENFKYLKGLGLEDVRMVSADPNPYDLTGEQFRHKLDIFKYAMEDFDEILFVDWDCVSKKKVPADTWERMGKKEFCQANLQQYRRRKCHWRGNQDSRKLPNAGFVYCREKDFPDEIIKCWERDPQPSSEPPLARAMDERMGGWVGMEKYWDLYEPDFCNIHRFSPYSKELIDSKDICFYHAQGAKSRKYVPGDGMCPNVKKFLDEYAEELEKKESENKDSEKTQ